MMAAQPSGDVRQDDVAVVELDREGRARKNLFDAAENFERRFTGVLCRFGLGRTGIGVTITCDSCGPFYA